MNKMVTIILLLLSSASVGADFILGRYEAVFETSYGVDILFEPNGKCIARQILYPEQEGETTEISERLCSWKFNSGIVTVISDKGSVSNNQFLPNLSELPHGGDEFKPGIIPLSGRYIVQEAYMWKLK